MNNAIVLHYSLYQGIYAAYLDDFRYKILIPVNEMQWKYMKGENSKITLFTIFIFHS